MFIRHRPILIGLSACAMIGANTASADNRDFGLELSPQYHQCAASFGGRFGAALGCIDDENARLDDKLRQNDQLILSRLSPAEQAEFVKNEHLWRRTRIIPCQNLLSPASAPSPQSSINANVCTMKERAARVIWTDMVLKGDFGPVSDLFSPGKLDDPMRQ